MLSNFLTLQNPELNKNGSPSNPLFEIQKNFNRAINELYGMYSNSTNQIDAFENKTLRPNLDIVETNDTYKVEVEMPGIDENDITVSINNNVLTINAEKSTSKQDKDKNYVYREINYGKYHAEITLPEFADMTNASSTFKKGMLWIDIPKKPESTKNNINIKVKKVD